MPLKAIHRPNACVVRQDSSALWRGRSARRLVRWMSTVASTTTQMLRGRIVVGGGVAVKASARVRSSPWEDAAKIVAPVWNQVEAVRAPGDAHGGTTDCGGALLGAGCVSEVDDVGVAGHE